MKKIVSGRMLLLSTLLAVAGAARTWADLHEGGTLNAQEKGDAVYRLLGGVFDDYHAAIFEGFSMHTYEDGSFGGPHPTLGIMDITFESNSTSGPTTQTFEGKSMIKHVSRRPGVVNWFKLSSPDAIHSKANMDQLQRFFVKVWGNRGSVEYRGAFTNSSAVQTGQLNASKRTEIIDELFYLRERDGNDRWNYEFVNMINYEWQRCGWWDLWLCSYFRNLNDVEDARCDFVPEWVYEKRGVQVWGKDSDWEKWISGGHTENADFHNDALDNSDDYYLSELSPMVQSGDYYLVPRDSRTRTTFRPSPAEAPIIDFFGNTSAGHKIHVKDNASERMFYSIEWFNADGTFYDYAKDNAGIPYKYRELALPNTESPYRSATVFPAIANAPAGGLQLKLVITDEGGNTTEGNYDNSYMPPPANNPPPPPEILMASSFGYAGMEFSVTGKNFGIYKEDNRVFINGQEVGISHMYTSYHSTGTLRSLHGVVPYLAVSGPITVKVHDRPSIGDFWFNADPRITAVYPSQALPGEVITIEGANFFADPAKNLVEFFHQSGYMRVSPLTASTTRLTVAVPEGSNGGGLRVLAGLSPNQWSAEWPTFETRPQIASFTPSAALPGAEVVIQGSNFHRRTTQDVPLVAPKVTFSGVTATVLSFDMSSVRVLVPQTASGDLVVAKNNGDDSWIPSPAATFYMVPAITSFSPEFGLAGQEVTINGSNFASDLAGQVVQFGTHQAEILSQSETQTVCKIPPGAVTGPVTVTSWGRTSSGRLFTITPVLSALSKTKAFPNTEITLTGQNFSSIPDENLVRFGGALAPVLSASPTTLTVKVPLAAKSGDVTVGRNNAVSNGIRFKRLSLQGWLSLLLE